MAGLLDLLGINAPIQTQNGEAVGPVGGWGGILGQLGNKLRDASPELTGFGMGMLSGSNQQEGFANALAGMNANSRTALLQRKQQQEEQQQAARMKAASEYARKYPQYAGMLAANPELADKFAAMEMQKKLNPDNPLDDEYKRAQIANLQAQAQGKNATFGLNPVYGTRKNPQTGEDETVILQPGNNGTIVEPKLPEGVKLANGIEKIDAGTQWIIKDKRTGQTIGVEPKDIKGVEVQKAQGEAQGAAAVALPDTLASADKMIGNIKELKTHPGRKLGLGYGANFPTVKGSDADAFERRVDEVKGGAYLQAIQKMRGLGALSEAEGKAATAALTRLNVSLNDKEFDSALDELTGILERGKENAQRKAAGNFTPAGGTGNSTLDAADAIVGLGGKKK